MTRISIKLIELFPVQKEVVPKVGRKLLISCKEVGNN